MLRSAVPQLEDVTDFSTTFDGSVLTIRAWIASRRTTLRIISSFWNFPVDTE